METKEFKHFLIKMSNLIHSNHKNPNRGFPISCIFIGQNKKLIVSKVNQKSQNKKQTNHKNHAEYLCLEELNVFSKKALSSSLKKIVAIITVPPCYNCLKEIKKIENINWEIYYLDDRIRNKSEKDYIKFFNQSKDKIEKLDFEKITNLNLRLRYWYCVYQYLQTNITYIYKRDVEDTQEKISKYNEFRESLKLYFLEQGISEKKIEPIWLESFVNEVIK